jgi:hypothetical protein
VTGQNKYLWIWCLRENYFQVYTSRIPRYGSGSMFHIMVLIETIKYDFKTSNDLLWQSNSMIKGAYKLSEDFAKPYFHK